MNVKKSKANFLLYLTLLFAGVPTDASYQTYLGFGLNLPIWHKKVGVKAQVFGSRNMIATKREAWKKMLGKMQSKYDAGAHMRGATYLQWNVMDKHCLEIRRGFKDDAGGLQKCLKYVAAALCEGLRHKDFNPAAYRMMYVDQDSVTYKVSKDDLVRYGLYILTPSRSQKENNPLELPTADVNCSDQFYDEYNRSLSTAGLADAINAVVDELGQGDDIKQQQVKKYLEARVRRNVPGMEQKEGPLEYKGPEKGTGDFAGKIQYASDAAYLAGELLALDNMRHLLEEFQENEEREILNDLIDICGEDGICRPVELLSEKFDGECELKVNLMHSLDITVMLLGLCEVNEVLRLGLAISVGKTWREYQVENVPLQFTDGYSGKICLAIGLTDYFQVHLGFGIINRWATIRKYSGWDGDYKIAANATSNPYGAQSNSSDANAVPAGTNCGQLGNFGLRRQSELDTLVSDVQVIPLFTCAAFFTIPLSETFSGYISAGWQTDLSPYQGGVKGFRPDHIKADQFSSFSFGVGVLINLQ